MLTSDDFKFGFKAKAERLGEEFRTKMGVSKFAPLDAFKLAEFIETPIFTLEDVFHGNENSLDFAHLSNPQNFSALCMPNENDEKIIIHNRNHSPARQQSNLMHELSHVILEHKIPDETAKLCFKFGLINYNKVQENEAKFLGGCLQITRAGLQWALKNLILVEKIAEHYSASVEMVKYRLKISGVIKQSFYAKRVSN